MTLQWKPYKDKESDQRGQYALEFTARDSKTGRFSVGIEKPEDTINRFWARVKTPLGIGECWEWMGKKHKGYGQIVISRKRIPVHRFAYEGVIGKIPEGLVIDHLCRNRFCVNPYHLEPVTRGTNSVRGDGPTGTNSRKTHCVKGHLLEGDNLVQADIKRGYRVCKTCKNAWGRSYWQRRSAN